MTEDGEGLMEKLREGHEAFKGRAMKMRVHADDGVMLRSKVEQGIKIVRGLSNRY